MSNYQLTGTESSTTFADLELEENASVIDTGAHVINVPMYIQKYWMDHTFGVLFVDGDHTTSDTLCTRSNLLQNMQLLDVNYATARDTLLGNCVGNVLGLACPVATPLRLKEMVDIMTDATQDANAITLDAVRSGAIETAIAKMIGDDTPGTPPLATTTTAHQIPIDNVLAANAMVDESGRTAFTGALAGHMALYMDGTFAGAATEASFTDATEGAATIDDTEADNVNTIVGQLINQAAVFGVQNKLFGATEVDSDPIPELADGVKAFHFLHFEIGDVLTFKNTVTISASQAGLSPAGLDLIVNFNLMVVGNSDATIVPYNTLGGNSAPYGADIVA